MDLQLSRRGDYAVRAAIALARNEGKGYTKIRDVSKAMNIPAPYTPQIMRILASAGMAEAKAGRVGGYKLARPAVEISLLEVIEAAEGALRSSRCTMRGEPCVWDSHCPVHDTWVAGAEALRAELAATSLASVSQRDAAKRAIDLEPSERRTK
ncbi:MAG TPA: Rrf2 family transcriptional regulator [Dehalococcoidia bacterium]|nr:Rrf2 family transcriptional regulator [Dehalococcoidia bacterium]